WQVRDNQYGNYDERPEDREDLEPSVLVSHLAYPRGKEHRAKAANEINVGELVVGESYITHHVRCNEGVNGKVSQHKNGRKRKPQSRVRPSEATPSHLPGSRMSARAVARHRLHENDDEPVDVQGQYAQKEEGCLSGEFTRHRETQRHAE